MAELRATISADNRPFMSVLRQTQGAAEGWAKNFSSSMIGHFGAMFAGGFIADKLIGLATNGLKEAANIPNLAEQFGMTTDQVQDLDEAMRKAGMDFQTFGTALLRFGAARKDAFGDEGTRDQFNSLFPGESWRKGAISDAQLMIELLTRAEGKQLDSAQRQGYRELFGKSGARLAASSRYIGEGDKNKLTPEQLKEIKDAQLAIDDAVHTAEQKIAKTGAELINASPITTPAIGSWWNPAARFVSRMFGAKGEIEAAAKDAAITATTAAKKTAEDSGTYDLNGPDLYPDEIALDKEAKRTKEIMDLVKRVNELRFEGLAPLKQEVELQQKMEDSYRESEELLSMGELREADRSFLQGQAYEEQLNNMRSKRLASEKSKHWKPTDSLVSIGNIAGGGFGGAGRQEQLLRGIEDRIRAVVENTAPLKRRGTMLPGF